MNGYSRPNSPTRTQAKQPETWSRRYVASGREWDLWTDPNVLQRLLAALPREWIVSGAQSHFARIKDKVRIVRSGDEIVSGMRVVETPGHTQGHISLELAGGDGLVIGGDALSNAIIPFQYPSWRVPVDHEANRGISTWLLLLMPIAANPTLSTQLV
jgi:glyoxylase-like metal-dependent hydrolase (beta-lactamase superfamily II)